MVIRHRGAIAGKPIFTYPEQPRATVAELRQRIRRCPTWLALRNFGHVSGHMLGRGESFTLVEGLPLPAHALPYLAFLAIDASNDHRAGELTNRDLGRLTSMYLSLSAPKDTASLAGRRAGLEQVLRTAQTLNHQAEMRNQTPRTLAILKDVWPRVPQASSIDPLAKLSSIVGIDLDRVLFFGQSFSGSRDGYARPYPSSVAGIFALEAQDRFLAWASGDYAAIRASGKEMRVSKHADDTFDLFEFNPLTRFPMVRPDVNPDPKGGPLYLVPSQRLLHERVGYGLFHLLADAHRGAGGGNAFRDAFGHVFQAYVGELLRAALGNDSVIPECSYLRAGQRVDTVDWLVFQDDCVVLIEVKQSALTLRTKTTGDLDSALEDMRKWLGKATAQLETTEDDIKARRIADLERLGAAREFDRLVVTYDSLYWGNSFLRDLIDDNRTSPARFTHFASIAELEYLLGASRKKSLRALLREKRLGSDGAAAMDLQDWLAREFTKEDCANPYLEARYDRAMEEWGIPPEHRRNALTVAQK